MDEYQQKVEEYNQSLRVSISKSRQHLSRHIKHTFKEGTDQPSLRRLSWTFSHLWRSSIDMQEQTDRLLTFKGGTRPFAIASSKQDAYHHNHFINTFLLSVLTPEADSLREEAAQDIFTACVIGSSDETERLEEMDKLYYHLSNHVLDLTDHPTKRITLETIYVELRRNYKKLEEIFSLLSTK